MLLKILMTTLFVAVGSSLIFAVLFAIAYSKLVAEEVRVKNGWQQIEHVFKERINVVPTLLAVFERFAASEKQILREVLDITAVIAKMDISADIVHESGKFSIMEESQIQLTLGVRRLMVLAERYPDILKVKEFSIAQAHLDGLENRMATQSREYNQAAKKFNKLVGIFPASLIANMMRFNKKTYFKKAMDAQQLLKREP